MGIRVNMTGVEINSFELLDPDFYVLKIVNTEEKQSQNGNPMVVITLEEEQSGIKIFHNLVFTDKTKSIVKSFLHAANQPCDGDINVEPFDWRGERVYCKVGIEKYPGKDGNEHEKNKILFFNKVEITGKPIATPSTPDRNEDDEVPF